MKHLILLLSTLSLSAAGLAQSSRPEPSVEDVLDRLERKLMEQEAKELRLSPVGRVRPERPTQQAIDLPSTSIAGSLPEQKDFQAIAEQIKDLERETDDLAGQIEKIKGEFQLKAGRSSLVEIVAELVAPDETAIRDLSFAINQHKLYHIQSGEGPWLPSSQILLYTGPLEPGEHLLQLQGRTVRRYAQNLPLDQNLYHRYDQTFRITIPEGAHKKGYRLKLARPDAQNIRAEAVLETYEIP